MPSTLPAIIPLKAVGGGGGVVDGGLGLPFEQPHALAGGIQQFGHMQSTCMFGQLSGSSLAWAHGHTQYSYLTTAVLLTT